jgi:hypothetical protein
MRERWFFAAAALAVIALIATLYWPVSHANFVWDDKICLHDEAWLRRGDWTQIIFRNFCGWTGYFRPLVLALFVAEVRGFDVAPGPMHLVSLALHLANTALVGALAVKVSAHARHGTQRWAAVVAMSVYGLHPVLVEPVVWISCQYELVATVLMLCGLLLNEVTRSTAIRAIEVALAFFLAACAKESAVVFPALLFLCDAFRQWNTARSTWRADLLAIWSRQRFVYAAVLLAGVAHLALRGWAIGYALKTGSAPSLWSFARLQEVALIYVSYWKLIVWPMFGLGPVHPFDTQQLQSFSALLAAIDAIAIALGLFGVIGFLKRKPVAVLILAASAALLPVLHLIPLPPDESLYHDRYAMTAIAIASVFLPVSFRPLLDTVRLRLLRGVALFVFVLWLGFAIIDIRVTVPLWSDDLALWQWAVREHPESAEVKDYLLTAYMRHDDRAHARELADELVGSNAKCRYCMINAAYLALAEHDPARAAAALSRLQGVRNTADDARLFRAYVLASGRLREAQGDSAGAENAYRELMRLNAVDPLPRLALAQLLAKEGKIAEARAAEDDALQLFPPDEREPRRQAFEQTLSTQADSTQQ